MRDGVAVVMDSGSGLSKGHLQRLGVGLNVQRVKRNTGVVVNLSWSGCILQVCAQRCDDAGAVIPGGVKVDLESVTGECCF